MDPQHAIFQGPLPVELEFEEADKPDDYYLYPGTRKLGEKLKVWRIQTKQFPEIDPGLVSSRDRFTATPDAEIISGGLNGKGPNSVAIARHGNYMLWGFYARPAHMTPSARRVFVNAVAYMDQFDGQAAKPMVQDRDLRKQMLGNVYYLRCVSDEYVRTMVDGFNEYMEENPDSSETTKEIAADPAAYFRKMYQSYVDELLEKIPAPIRKECDDDTERLIKYYDDNFDYLVNENGSYEVDQDAKTLGVSNRDVALLKKCVDLLQQDKQTDRAIRVLTRYTDGSFEESSKWIDWWKETKSKLHYDVKSEKFLPR